MPGLRIELDPVEEPVTLTMLKNHMHESTTDNDDLIAIYLSAARVKIEGFLGRSLINKGYVQTFDHFPRRNHEDGGSFGHDPGRRHYRHLEIKLGRAPLVAVSRVEYLDLNGTLQTMLPRIDTPWAADTIYTVGQQILDSNGNVQEVATGEEEGGEDSSHSGSVVPTWGTSTSDPPVADGEITWKFIRAGTPGDFIVDTNGEPGRIYPNVNINNYFWPYTQRVPNAVRIHFTAGYGVITDNVPAHFKTALMIYTKGLYDFRDPLLTTPGAKPTELPSHLRDLLWEDRIKDFAPTEG